MPPHTILGEPPPGGGIILEKLIIWKLSLIALKKNNHSNLNLININGKKVQFWEGKVWNRQKP